MWALTLAAVIVSVVSALIALGSVAYARRSANASVQSAEAALRSADLAEVVERGRHHGWRIEARTNDVGPRYYTLRNVGTVNAIDVRLAGEYLKIEFRRVERDQDPVVNIAAGQARLFVVVQTFNDNGGEVHITWTPDLPDAMPMTWTEVPPIAVETRSSGR